MFYYNPEEVTESSVRKLIRKVGLENMQDLIDLRIADRLGSGTPKAKPYKLRHLEYIIEKVSQDPISVKMLKINGNDLQKNLHIPPGPKIGAKQGKPNRYKKPKQAPEPWSGGRANRCGVFRQHRQHKYERDYKKYPFARFHNCFPLLNVLCHREKARNNFV